MANQYQPFYGGGYDPYSPEAQFQQFLSGQTRDVGMQARPLLDPTLARYQMGLYRDPTQSFRQFLQAYTPPDAAGIPFSQTPQALTGEGYLENRPYSMLDEATEAGRVAGLTAQQFTDEFGAYDPETQNLQDLAMGQRRAVMGRDYLTGENAAQNQIRWANALLGQQFAAPTGQTPGQTAGVGQQALAAPVRRAIGNVMNELYTARLAQGNPGTGFLNWFTGRMGGQPIQPPRDL